MVKNFANQLAAVALTLVMSATLVAGAVGPASATGKSAVASTVRFMA